MSNHANHYRFFMSCSAFMFMYGYGKQLLQSKVLRYRTNSNDLRT